MIIPRPNAIPGDRLVLILFVLSFLEVHMLHYIFDFVSIPHRYVTYVHMHICTALYYTKRSRTSRILGNHWAYICRWSGIWCHDPWHQGPLRPRLGILFCHHCSHAMGPQRLQAERMEWCDIPLSWRFTLQITRRCRQGGRQHRDTGRSRCWQRLRRRCLLRISSR